MRIPRIYSDLDFTVGQLIALDREASNHLNRVLRLKVGNPVILFKGDGTDFHAEIETIDRNQVTVQIQSSEPKNLESPLHIHLYQGVSRGDKMDLTLQKGVELGIKEFTPILTERCGVKLDAKRWEKKVQHWKKVIQSACEQCGRSRLPTLNPVTDLVKALEQTNDSHHFFLHPEAETAFKAYSSSRPVGSIALWVGPEGGFSEPEVEQVIQRKITPVQLGPRVLRTETAALAAVSVMNALWGDF